MVTPKSSPAPPMSSAPLNSVSKVSDTVDDNKASTKSKPSQNARWVYYRIYTQDIGIVSKQPTSCDQPYLGRIKAISVPPRRTAYLFKRALCKVEKITDYESATLFITNSSASPINDTERVLFLSDNGPGSNPNKPLALVVKVSDLEMGSLDGVGAPDAPDSESASSVRRYVYYRLYEDTDIPSKHPIDADDPSLARIDINLIPPPHTPSSIMRCICRAENHPFGCGHQLFADNSSEDPMDEGHVSLLTGDVGATPKDALALVKCTSTQELICGMNRKFKPKFTCDPSKDDPRWLALTQSDVYYTDGVIRKETNNAFGTKPWECYEARDSAGRTGFIDTWRVIFCE